MNYKLLERFCKKYEPCFEEGNRLSTPASKYTDQEFTFCKGAGEDSNRCDNCPIKTECYNYSETDLLPITPEEIERFRKEYPEYCV
jgi:hypothetical protein